MRLTSIRLFLLFFSLLFIASTIFISYNFSLIRNYEKNTQNLIQEEHGIKYAFIKALQYLIQSQKQLHEDLEKSGALSSDALRYLSFSATKIKDIIRFPYKNMFSEDEIYKIDNAQRKIVNDIIPNLKLNYSNETLINSIDKINDILLEISSIAPIRRIAKQETIYKNQIKIASLENILIFASTIVISILSLIGFFLLQRRKISEERKKYFHSFSNLFAHATVSRICSLKLFLGNLDDHYKLPSKEDVKTARQVITEIETVTADLLDVTDPQPHLTKEPLQKLLQEVVHHIKKKKEVAILFDMPPEVALLNVPVAQLRLMLDELIQNAVESVENVPHPKIIIRAYLQKRWFCPTKKLVLEIIDNGTGMNPKIAKKATDPYVSEKGKHHQGNHHRGLGLSNCAGLISSLKGKLKINSVKEKGTTIRVELPFKE